MRIVYLNEDSSAVKISIVNASDEMTVVYPQQAFSFDVPISEGQELFIKQLSGGKVLLSNVDRDIKPEVKL